MSIMQSRFQQKITKLAKTDKDTLLYAADQIGYIYVYNMNKYSPEQKSPRGQLHSLLALHLIRHIVEDVLLTEP